jgi:hypothetical protein
MANFFLKLGVINKKLIMPVITAVIYVIMDIIELNADMNDIHIIFNLYTRGISYTCAILVPIVQKRCDKNRQKIRKRRAQCTKRSILHFTILQLEYIIYFGLYIYLTKLKSKDPDNTEDFQMSHYHGLCSEEAVEIIFIVIISKFLLKTQLYIHHYIGLIILVIASLSIDIPFNLSLFKPQILFIVIYLLFIIVDANFITYEKYMMDKLYYSPFVIVFSIGILFLSVSIFFTIYILMVGNSLYDGKKYTLQSFSDYFEEKGYKTTVIYMFYCSSFRFFLNILKILTIYYFTQNHIYTSYTFIKLVDLLIMKKTNYKYFSIILFIPQFLGLLIFLEIIELNFCKLNKNTKINIEKRELKEDLNDDDDQNDEDIDPEERKSKQSIVEISPGYLVNSGAELESFNDEKEQS